MQREEPGLPGLVCCPRLELSAPNGGRIVRPRPARAAAVRQPLQQQQAVESCGRAAQQQQQQQRADCRGGRLPSEAHSGLATGGEGGGT